MTGNRDFFKTLDESKKSIMKLGNDKELKVEERGTIKITTLENKVRLLNMQYVPNLAHSLLSVGQILANGYSVMFDANACMIRTKESSKLLTKI